MQKPPAIKLIRSLVAEQSKRLGITADRIANELAKLAFANIKTIQNEKTGGLISPHELDDDVAAAIQSIEVVTRYSGEVDENGYKLPEYVHKIRLHDKKGALELLGKTREMFTERMDHTSSDGSMTPKGSDLDVSQLSNQTLKELIAARRKVEE